MLSSQENVCVVPTPQHKCRYCRSVTVELDSDSCVTCLVDKIAKGLVCYECKIVELNGNKKAALCVECKRDIEGGDSDDSRDEYYYGCGVDRPVCGSCGKTGLFDSGWGNYCGRTCFLFARHK